jgi:hypothetical protein
MRTLFTDETLVAPLASFVHNMMETSVDEQHGIASRRSHDFSHD